MSEAKKIGVAVIACGARSRSVVYNLLRDSQRGVEILDVPGTFYPEDLWLLKYGSTDL